MSSITDEVVYQSAHINFFVLLALIEIIIWFTTQYCIHLLVVIFFLVL